MSPSISLSVHHLTVFASFSHFKETEKIRADLNGGVGFARLLRFGE